MSQLALQCLLSFQVERVFIPPKPKIYNNVSLNANNEEADEPEQPLLEEEKKEEDEVTILQFKITGVHVVGIKTEPTKSQGRQNVTTIWFSLVACQRNGEEQQASIYEIQGCYKISSGDCNSSAWGYSLELFFTCSWHWRSQMEGASDTKSSYTKSPCYFSKRNYQVAMSMISY